MREYSSIAGMRAGGITAISAAIGVFDGVHAGHRHLLSVLTELAAETQSVPVAVTFSPHPRQVLAPDYAPPLLLPPAEKIRRLAGAGAQAVVTIPFTKEFAALPPEQFIEECLRGNGIELRALCVGKDWRFGANGAGNTDLLAALAEKDGFLFSAVPELQWEDGIISSSAIRAAAASGCLEKASRYLTEPYAVYGTVVHGYGVAGSRLQTPTANLQVEYGVIPPDGVYAAIAETDGTCRHAVVNIGAAPTFRSYGQTGLRRVEVHLLHGGGDLYGRNMILRPVAYLRPEQRFPNQDELRKQIQLDCKTAAEILQEKETAES